MSRELLAPLPASPDPNRPQKIAATPENIVWVSASAGSGKTKVLTDRVLRLLLPDPEGRWLGTSPHRLLCITYTKAGAAEMALRVNDRLGKWAVMPEPELAMDLAELTGDTPRAEMIEASRKLFADVLDCPGGLKIMTIHAFCQSVLGRFPLEAGVNPDFTVIDDQVADEILSQVLDTILLQAQINRDSDLAKAFQRLAVILQLDDLVKNIRSVLRNPDALEAYFSRQQTMSVLEGDIVEALGSTRTTSIASTEADFIAATPEAALRSVVTSFAQETETLKKIGINLQAWLDLSADQRVAKIDDYALALLTTTGSPRKLGKFADKDPEATQLFNQECARLIEFKDRTTVIRQAQNTAALLILARSALQGYEEEKRHRDGLDYHDLIRKTDALLKSTSAQWVHFKLDGGIDHILMDEAQDTNPYQWSILEHLSSEIFAGLGREAQSPRSLFVVGDKKQSIFSFQGADPRAFDRMQSYFTERAAEAERELKRIPLEVSFRSAAPVLTLVDAVFETPELRSQIGLPPDETLKHYSHFSGNAGLVELWPLIIKTKPKKSDKWQLPFATNDDSAAQESLAENIAQEIWSWLEKGEILESQGRAMTPGDILILVRTRTHLVHELVRQLKRRNIPVSGVDRLKLGEQIGVQDLLALAKFARLPADEFSLACVLKSPLVGLSEDDLMNLALGRPDGLWETLQSRGPAPVTDWLAGLILQGRKASPFEFLEACLNQGCPADPAGSGWRAMTKRLGRDVIDPLEELISLCLKLEGQGVRTLEDLILWQQKTEVQIKREMEEAGGQVRIMTVHASKGLEAPVVILPDTTSVPSRATLDKFLWPEDSGLNAPLWAARSGESCAAFMRAQDARLEDQRAESSRLLYVALTRARDRLYIMGAQSKNSTAPTWYSLVQDAFSRLDGVEETPDGRKQKRSSQTGPVKDISREGETYVAPTAAPSWLLVPPQAEQTKARPFSPSRQDDATLSSLTHSPIDAAHPYRFKRGNITHKLFQFLPDLPAEKRRDAALYYIARAGADLPEDVRISILDETFRVLHDPDFAPVFGEGSFAEVPVTGSLPDGRIINGQIDRLIIREQTILIVDYKTNRPSPRNADEIPEIYRAQLRAYRDALAAIYPKSLIKCALLWTDQPLLMPVPI
jgi:ATP-dependent helicase/nuclease subunit A